MLSGPSPATHSALRVLNPPSNAGFSQGQAGRAIPRHDLWGRCSEPPAWRTSREEAGIKENIPQVFLQKSFCVWFLGEFSCLLTWGMTVGLKARILIFSWCYLPCQVLGLNFSDAQGLGFGRSSLTSPPPPPGAQLTAGGDGFSLGPQPGF